MMDYVYVIVFSHVGHIMFHMMYYIDILYVPYHVYNVPPLWATTYVLGVHVIYEGVLDRLACGLIVMFFKGDD